MPGIRLRNGQLGCCQMVTSYPYGIQFSFQSRYANPVSSFLEDNLSADKQL
jgi:hypothetical protein